jgi:hypothetical protein
MALFDESLENFRLDKWSHVAKGINKSLFSGGKSILQAHGCIHKENIIVSINPSCQHNFINV